MKRALILLLAALLAGLLAYTGVRFWPSAPARAGILLDEMNELFWLRQELGLTDAQIEAVAKVHHEYRPKCEEMCARIHEADEKLTRLAADSRTMTPELSAAIHEAARVRAECQEAMIGHLHQTAALLEPAQAEKYLAAMLPLALGTSTPESGHAGH
ncbi:MAG: periplasmic heavy metal sensor [Verrucomicrobiales bacterium]